MDHRLVVPDSVVAPRDGGGVGVQTPRHFHAPDWSQTAGEDVIDLASAIGLEMLPWQKLVLRNAMCEDPRTGEWDAFQVGLVVPRQNGKNYILRARLLAGLFLFGEERLVHSAHLFKTAHNEYLEIVRVIEETPEFLSMVKSMPDSRETAIILKDGRRLDFMSRARSGGRGLQGDCVVLDEAFALSQTLVSDLLPVLSSRPSPQVWYTSSTGFDYSETLMAVRKKALESPEDNKHLAYFEWCADLDETDWRSREAVQQSNPSFGYLQTWDWIKETELGVMGEEEYQRERLGIWADRSTSAVIGADKWEAAFVTGEVLAGAKVVRRSLGLEVTADRDFAVIGGAAELSDGRIVVDVVRAGEGVAWIQDELAVLSRKHKPHAGVVVDSFSAASSMANPLGQAGVDVSLASTKDIVAGTAEVFDRLSFDSDGVADPQLLHGRDALLDDAAYTARKRLVGQSRTAWTWQQHGEVMVEPLRAITLAVSGLSMEPVRKKRRARVA